MAPNQANCTVSVPPATDDDIEKQIIDLPYAGDCPPNGYPAPSTDEMEKQKFHESGVTARSLDTHSETHQDDHISTRKSKLHKIADINTYKGSTLEEKLDTLIQSHPVVMINRTWCLFSVDAQNFLIQQMNASVHSIEVDLHPQGKKISKYMKEKTKHYTTPCIFIKGEFLGGFKEVNALYAEGKLQKLFPEDLSQDNQCETFFSGAQYKTEPYFWFPEKVDGNVVRITGVVTCFASVICAFLVQYLFWARYIAYAIAIDFVLRLLGGAKFSLIGRISILSAFYLEPIPRMGRPKQFAACCGILFSGLGSLAFLLPFPHHDVVGSVLMSVLAVATGMEGFLDFCVCCLLFRMGVLFGIFQGTS
ncbi:unnamed protein product [Cylindrotheca closterium]|uniref:Glutaredoxin domain-containing protein n=1 Tax=Cylindrotheca closterium TaxID=2856 RepID=A0AAD2FU54_9STRA|nr:unnamed protein product [Cylindrotheca closterium]